MNLNATLIAQTVVFLILAWFTMKFIWPPLIDVLDQRSKKIAEGLAAAEQSKIELANASQQANQTLAHARQEGQLCIAGAQKHAQATADEIKRNANAEAMRIIANAKIETERQIVQAREMLREELALLAIKGAEQILKREVDSGVHLQLLNRLKAEL